LSDILQSKNTAYTLLHVFVPSADIGDWSDGVTVTVNIFADIPPVNSRFTITNPAASDPEN